MLFLDGMNKIYLLIFIFLRLLLLFYDDSLSVFKKKGQLNFTKNWRNSYAKQAK